MKTTHFSAEQIVAILHEAAAGVPVRELCRKLGITETTFYRWRRWCNEVQRVRQP